MRIATLFLVSALAVAAHAAPRRLNDFGALMKALESGHTVKTVIHYKKTEMTIDGKVEPAPDAIGGMAFTPWEYFAKGVVRNELAYVVSSETHLISHPRYGYVNNYVRMRIYEDNTVEITARYITLTDQKNVMDETFRGRISNGKDKHGIHLFAQ